MRRGDKAAAEDEKAGVLLQNLQGEWWTEHPERIRQKAVYEFICAKCGRAFTAYGNKKRKYCSHECYIADRFGGGGNG